MPVLKIPNALFAARVTDTPSRSRSSHPALSGCAARRKKRQPRRRHKRLPLVETPELLLAETANGRLCIFGRPARPEAGGMQLGVMSDVAVKLTYDCSRVTSTLLSLSACERIAECFIPVWFTVADAETLGRLEHRASAKPLGESAPPFLYVDFSRLVSHSLLPSFLRCDAVRGTRYCGVRSYA